MTVIKKYDNHNQASESEIVDIVEFLYKELEEFGDSKQAIEKSIRYSFSNEEGKGGFILMSYENNILASVLVMNKTGMKDYIPENILVYIATKKALRGKGIGKELIMYALSIAGGDIALHVEPNNPAKYLYEKIGFTNKYLEMRYITEGK